MDTSLSFRRLSFKYNFLRELGIKSFKTSENDAALPLLNLYPISKSWPSGEILSRIGRGYIPFAVAFYIYSTTASDA